MKNLPIYEVEETETSKESEFEKGEDIGQQFVSQEWDFIVCEELDPEEDYRYVVMKNQVKNTRKMRRKTLICLPLKQTWKISKLI